MRGPVKMPDGDSEPHQEPQLCYMYCIVLMRGQRPEVKCSMMAAKISGFSTLHTYSSLFVTVTKSDPKKTPVTPSMTNRRLASGELNPSLAESKLLDPLCTATISPCRE